MFGIGGPELVILIPIFIIFYLLPTVIARTRRHKNILPIFVLNILLGWTFLGWVVALVWSFTAQEERNSIYKSEDENKKYLKNIDSAKCYLCAKIFPKDQLSEAGGESFCPSCLSKVNPELLK